MGMTPLRGLMAIRIRRWEFIVTLADVGAVLPIAARAQQIAMAVVLLNSPSFETRRFDTLDLKEAKSCWSAGGMRTHMLARGAPWNFGLWRDAGPAAPPPCWVIWVAWARQSQ